MTITARPPTADTHGAQIVHEQRKRLAALRVDVADRLHATDKSLVLAGRQHGKQVVVKLLTSTEPYWRAKFAAEQALYRRLHTTSLPVRIARLVHAEPGLTILERLPGIRLGDTRYPDQVSVDSLTRVLDTLDLLHRWQPGPQVLGDPEPISDSELVRHTASGQLTAADLQAINVLRDRIACEAIAVRPEHGDALAANLLIDPTGVGLVDLEHLGWHTPGTDHALLYLLLGPGTPAARDLITARVHRDGLETPFAVQVMLLACREWTLHQSFGATVWETARPVLRANLDHARTLLHTTAGTA